MELYIEKEFLDNFYLDYDNKHPRSAQKILRTIFKEYGGKKSLLTYSVNSPIELETLKTENPFFAELASHFPPIEIENIEDHYFNMSNAYQTIILTKKNYNWFEKAEERGAICMTFDNYEKKIQEFIESSHFRIDLSEDFRSWDVFEFCQNIPLTCLMINDNYILSNKSNQRMDDNVIQLLKKILHDRKTETKIKVFTKDFNPDKPGTPDQFNEAALKRHKKLNSGLANFKKSIQTINNNLPTGHDLHDRVILSNYFMVDSGKGFNLIPHKKSNSQLLSESIFNKYTYKRLKNHLKMLDEYCSEIEWIESLYFKTIGNA